ncbi:MAG TPA: hypothetical protein VNY77_05810 [Candidatus Angelobacter sp.]|nr:hypothetical protein [Candidatus Angelobacter sp.]
MTWQLDVQIPDGGSLDVYMNQIGEFQIGLGPDAGPGLMASFVGGSPFPFPSDAAFHRLQFRQAGDGGVVVLIDGDAGTTFVAGVGSVAVISLAAGVTGPSAPVHVDNVLLTAP